MPGSHPVSDYPTAQGILLVSTSDIIAVLWAETIWVGSTRLGFAPEDVGTHSLRSGGPMAMHIADVPDQTLMDIGRWRLLGFMVYDLFQPKTGCSLSFSGM